MKKRRPLLIALVCGIVALAPLAWYHGFIPVGSATDNARMRFVLNLKFLPSSVRVNASGVESWTDYIVEADLSIAPEQFDRLLSGREFVRDPERMYQEKTTYALRIPDHAGFEIDAIWRWSHRPPGLRDGQRGPDCVIYANKERDRVFIRYTAD